VALFDDKGSFLCYCEFESPRFYEDFVTDCVTTNSNCNCNSSRLFNRGGDCNFSRPKSVIKSSGRPRLEEEYTFDCWKAETYGVHYEWQGGWTGDAVDPHHTLTTSLVSLVSPIEAMFVLMHALSSDARSIFAYTLVFFDNFDRDLNSWSVPEFFNEAERGSYKALCDLLEGWVDWETEKH